MNPIFSIFAFFDFLYIKNIYKNFILISSVCNHDNFNIIYNSILYSQIHIHVAFIFIFAVFYLVRFTYVISAFFILSIEVHYPPQLD